MFNCEFFFRQAMGMFFCFKCYWHLADMLRYFVRSFSAGRYFVIFLQFSKSLLKNWYGISKILVLFLLFQMILFRVCFMFSWVWLQNGKLRKMLGLFIIVFCLNKVVKDLLYFWGWVFMMIEEVFDFFFELSFKQWD